MFTYAAGLYAVGTIVVSLIPVRMLESEQSSDLVVQSENDDDVEQRESIGSIEEIHPNETADGDLEEPLLSSSPTEDQS